MKNSKQKTTKPVNVSTDLEQKLLILADQKFNKLEDSGDQEECPCNTTIGNTQKTTKVDLIILVDTSGSMGSKAKAVNDAADKAIKAASQKCNVDLKVTWLGIEGKFASTKFDTSAREYLIENGCKPKYAKPGYTEEGADTIADLVECSHIWREDACRAIFYISDEPLDESAPQGTVDALATQGAIQIAQGNDVTVFAHLESGLGFHTVEGTAKDYKDLCEQTGGKAYIGEKASIGLYEQILTEVICSACGTCASVDLPNVAPCISVLWGDSDCDCIESNDLEVLMIKVSNCYDNIAFEQLVIGEVQLTDLEGNAVPNLPDGTPSLEVYPSGPICFGDLAACTDAKPTAKAREIVVRSRGAIDGQYKLTLHNITFSVTHRLSTENDFVINVCRD